MSSVSQEHSSHETAMQNRRQEDFRRAMKG